MSEVVQNVAIEAQARRPSRRFGRWNAAGIALLVLAGGIPLGLSRYDSWRDQRSKDFGRKCRALRRASDWETLAVTADQWRSWDTTSADAILFRAEAAQGKGDFQATADLLFTVPERSPKRLSALIERTTLLFGPLNQPLEGVQACQQILELEPRTFTINQRLIFYFAMTNQQEQLLRQIYQSIQLGCEPVEAYVYLMLADVLTFQNGFEVTNRWLAADASQEIFLVSRTIHMWKNLSLESPPSEETKEKLQLAVKLLQDYLVKYPENMTVLTFFANLAADNGEADQVEAMLLRFPEAGKKNGHYWRLKGWLHAAKDEPSEAEAAYRESLRIFPFSWSVQHELADILRRRRDYSQVAQMQELALLGKKLRQELLELPNASLVSDELLTKIRDYASQCGDDFVAESLTHRLRKSNQ